MSDIEIALQIMYAWDRLVNII